MRQMVRATAGLLLALCAMQAGPRMAEAQENHAVVVEFYTSQGCSSCPPADAFVAGLADSPDLIVLSLHVDYWDYIGWEDRFARAEFTERQKAYARAIGSRTIYTPQLILGGTDRVQGFAPEEFAGHLARQLSTGPEVALQLTRAGDVLSIRAQSAVTTVWPSPARVQLVRYLPEATVDIERGENAGKTVSYRNIVTSWETLGDWSGAEPLEMTATVAGDEPAVVIVQAPGPSRILAAGRVD